MAALRRHPNVLFLIADDHRGAAIHALGDATVITPAMDGLVRDGAAFPRTYILGGLCGAVCVPTRAALHTGASFFRGCARAVDEDYAGQVTLNPALPTLAETFRAAGYRTYGIGKWHNCRASFQKGFTGGARLFFGGMSDHCRVPVHDFDPSGAYPAEAARPGDRFSSELFADAAVNFLRAHDRRQPFFLYLAFTSPHDPRTAPPPYATMYPPDQVPLPANYRAAHPFDNGELQVRDELLAPFPRTTAAIRQHVADYYAMISHQDAQMSRILQTLAERGLAADTIVVYTADHGLAVGQHGLMGKQNLYEHSVRVPLLLRGPGVPRGKRFDTLACAYDLYPTLCDLAGLPTPGTVEACSLAPVLAGRTDAVRDIAGSAYRGFQRMVTDGQWKLIRYYRAAPDGPGTDRVQLFNLAEDPWEVQDLSTVPGRRKHLDRLTAALAAWQHDTGDFLAPAR